MYFERFKIGQKEFTSDEIVARNNNRKDEKLSKNEIKKSFFFLFWRIEIALFCRHSISHCHYSFLDRAENISNFPRFHKNLNSSEHLNNIFENSLLKGSFWTRELQSNYRVALKSSTENYIVNSTISNYQFFC